MPPFQWTLEGQNAFDTLKHLLVTAPILAYTKAVLSQEQGDGHLHPIAYASWKLQAAEKNYAITELETLGLVWAAKCFRPYLVGHQCVAYTDHSACTSLLNYKNPSPKLARWAMIIQELNLIIKHRLGKRNQCGCYVYKPCRKR